MQIDEQILTTILGRHFSAIMGEIAEVKDDVKKARKDIQEVKVAQRWGKRRDWNIIKRLKGS